LVTGGSLQGFSCSRCSWLTRCQGCLLPNDDTEVILRDGESIAIDWHFVVYEELIDIAATMEIQRHSSVAAEAVRAERTGIPLSKCLEKFTEEEKLEGVVCPKCKDDANMKKSLALWRMPPILVVQLKRFQFDQVSRRKITNRVEFPMEGLDLTSYVAPARFLHEKEAGDGDKEKQKEKDVGGNFSADGCTSCKKLSVEDEAPLVPDYDLYSVVHHIGALGGGHYVTTVRQRQKDKSSSVPSSRNASVDSVATAAAAAVAVPVGATGIEGAAVLPGGAGASTGGMSPKDRWWLFNDDVVTTLERPTDVISPSAYLLFYMRRDVQNCSVADLFPQSYFFNPPKEAEAATAAGEGSVRDKATTTNRRPSIEKTTTGASAPSSSSTASNKKANPVPVTVKAAPVRRVGEIKLNSRSRILAAAARSARTHSEDADDEDDHRTTSSSGSAVGSSGGAQKTKGFPNLARHGSFRPSNGGSSGGAGSSSNNYGFGGMNSQATGDGSNCVIM
jgi:hypothetical protein